MAKEIERNKPGFLMIVVPIFVSFWFGVFMKAQVDKMVKSPEPDSGTGFYCEESSYHWIGTKKEYLKFKNRVRLGECEMIGMFGEENGKEDIIKQFKEDE